MINEIEKILKISFEGHERSYLGVYFEGSLSEKDYKDFPINLLELMGSVLAAANLLGGIGDSVNEVVTGIYDMCRHQIRTTLGLGQMFLNPIPVFATIDEAIGDSFVKNLIHGDANIRARFIDRAGFEIGIIVLSSKVASIGKISLCKKVKMAFKGIDFVKGVSKT
ncbi:hypothetical protein [Tepidibacter hydrothermalis]|uniref:Uncharacterized protein n=1 Tax=Tepidibacter hydrothermalis TaxID=3036126 RepID=A0ABY8E7Y8_9FIRM|nr:hypothetical protein [Tepidibacter hydrothermalis]WFD08956.1 hypothetical protein P4S50_11210 [Tepidibacter hydrothermalis]